MIIFSFIAANGQQFSLPVSSLQNLQQVRTVGNIGGLGNIIQLPNIQTVPTIQNIPGKCFYSFIFILKWVDCKLSLLEAS